MAVVLVLATSDHAVLRGWEPTVAALIVWGFIGAGLYAWWRRPAKSFGPLLPPAHRTDAIHEHPDKYEARVASFFDRTL